MTETWKPNRPLMFTIPEQFLITRCLSTYIENNEDNEIAKQLYHEFARGPEKSKYIEDDIIDEK